MTKNEKFTYFEEGERFITLSFRGLDEESVYIPYVNVNAIDDEGNIYFTLSGSEYLLYVDNMQLDACENPEDKHSPVTTYWASNYFISDSNNNESLTGLFKINNNN